MSVYTSSSTSYVQHLHLQMNCKQLIELQPTTRVGHSDGFYYLELFSLPYHQSLRAKLGCYLTIMELVAVAALYRRKIGGSAKIIGDPFAHFERNKDEGYV